MATASTILVIGGGISGLACAWRLRQLGQPVLLLERSRCLGGIIDTVEQDGFRFDIGPQSFTNTQALSELIGELGLGSEILRADPRAPRYILKRDRLVPAPLSPPRLLLTPLLGARTKLRILSEPFRRSRPPDTDESVAAFVKRKFGADLLANLVAPFVSGIWAGDPEKLSLASAFPSVRLLEQRYGSVIRGAMTQRRENGGNRPSLCNFRAGLKTLAAALATKLGDSSLTEAEITAIRRAPAASRRFEVAYKLQGATQSLSVAAVVLATPADETARLLNGIEPGFGELLARIEYASLAQVSAGYGLEQINYRDAEKGLKGFGFLVPRSEGLRLLGTVWNSSLFPGRAAQGMASFTSFLGGMTDLEIASYSPERIGAIAHSELSSVLGVTGAPVAQHVSRWQRALPQYNIGHQGTISALRDLAARTPGIFLAGNYFEGPSMGACVEHANEIARHVARFCSVVP
ncbi:MAG: protoporphyrinogen oxidase [Acidobacteria bacterium]|nr:MAG: protoporphyrinogen oxidase [Acidobacteriota bacterium]